MISRQQESKTFNPLFGPEMPARASNRSRDTLLQIHFRALVRDGAVVQRDSNRVGVHDGSNLIGSVTSASEVEDKGCEIVTDAGMPES